MYRHDHVLRLVGLIYDAALDPTQWPQFLDRFAEVIHGQSAVLWAVTSSGALSLAVSARLDPAFREVYTGHYADSDPWVLAAQAKGRIRPGVVGLGEELVPARELSGSEFYIDLGKQFGMTGGIGAFVGDTTVQGGISAHQLSFGQFGEAERRLVAALLPHLDRALEVHRRLAAIDSTQRATADILDRLPVAAFLVDHHARPLFVNRTGRELIGRRDGLHSTHEGLTTTVSNETRALRAMVTACAATSAGDGLQRGGTVKVSRRDAQPSLQVMVSPVRLDAGVFGSMEHPAAIIFVHDPSRRLDVEPAILRELYGLTPAEARIAALMAQGRTITEIHALLGVSANTVRTHVKRLLQKTQTRTQSQLVQVILTGLARIAG